jgi:adenylate kinase
MVRGPRLLVLGRQGAGKGTQAARLALHFGVPHISTGDMFRAAAAAGTPFGRQARDFMQRGDLVPDAVVIGVVAERLAMGDTLADGFILDGFPRTRAQAEELERLLAPAQLHAAVDIVVPDDVVLDRLSGRRVCRACGAIYSVDTVPADGRCHKDGGDIVQREDDRPAAIRRRLDLYDREAGPLLDFYEARGLLARVDGTGGSDEVFERVLQSVGRFVPATAHLAASPLLAG